jgi:BASS family bile acid:Na+ symporter
MTFCQFGFVLMPSFDRKLAVAYKKIHFWPFLKNYFIEHRMNVIDLLIGGILAFIMLSVGMSLNWKDFTDTFAHPKAYLGGLFLQLLVLPAFAFLIATYAPLPLAFKLGIIVLATCPGWTTSNFVTYLLNANAAFSI